MNTDCSFYIGTTHEICQDYALTNNNSIVISDGCSGSIKSDIGARILSITTMNKMKELENLYNFEGKECILLARPSIQILNLPYECLDATILSAIIYDDSIQTMCYGDGVIAIKIKNKDIIIINCSYIDSYPFYINYFYDKTGRYKNWINNNNKRKICLSTIKKDESIDPLEKELNLEINLRIGIGEDEIGILKHFDNKTIIEIADKNIIEFIAIMSDGVHSFYETIITETSKYNKSISYLDVLKELLSFKNYNKLFVQRRINKFRKDCAKKNWANADDLSLAVIYMG